MRGNQGHEVMAWRIGDWPPLKPAPARPSSLLNLHAGGAPHARIDDVAATRSLVQRLPRANDTKSRDVQPHSRWHVNITFNEHSYVTITQHDPTPMHAEAVGGVVPYH